MAKLMSYLDGNNTDSVWGLINITSFFESETTAITVPTTYATTYTTFTPGAITIDGLAIRLCARLGTTGTFSIQLYNSTGAAAVTGTEVTINCSEFPDGIQSQIDGGWCFFKLPAPVLLSAATAYSVRFRTSTSTQISVWGGSATTPSRFVRTTTIQTAAAGDDRYIAGEYETGSIYTTRTIYLNNTGSIVDYGSATSSLVNPAMSISNGGIVVAETGSGVQYSHRLSGNLTIYNGGIFRIGTSSSPFPSSSAFTNSFDCVANVDFGIDVKRKGELSIYGSPKTRWAYLTNNVSASNTVIPVSSTYGWQSGDMLAFTQTLFTGGETRSIATVDSPTQVTLSSGLLSSHSASRDIYTYIVNMTSNVKIRGTSNTLGTFLTARGDSNVTLDNVEILYYGSATTNKRGVQFLHTGSAVNSCIITSCSFREGSNTSALVGNTSTNSNNAQNFYFRHNTIHGNISQTSLLSLYTGGLNPPNYDVSNCLIFGINSSPVGVILSTVRGDSGSFNNNFICGVSTGLNLASGTSQLTSSLDVINCQFHAVTTGITSTNSQVKLIRSCSFYGGQWGIFSIGGRSVVDLCSFIGQSQYGLSEQLTGGVTRYDVTVNNCTFRSTTQPLVATTPHGISLTTTNSPNFVINSSSFGISVIHSTSDIQVLSYIQASKIVFNKCLFASTTEITATAHERLDENSYIGFQRIDGTENNHKTIVKYGVVTVDTTIFRTSTPSIRFTPKSLAIECKTQLFPFKVPVSLGQTCTPLVYVRESVVGDGTDYNGGFIKLYVKTNYNLGILDDTIISTSTIAAVGAWELLTGTTIPVEDNGVLEFYIVCSGTTGWINIDDFTATTT